MYDKVSASASAKTILFGEHAVVYDEPAIAIPLKSTRTYVDFSPNEKQFRIKSSAIHLNRSYEELHPGSGLQVLLSEIQKHFHLTEFPKATLSIRSEIPIAAGLGSGAALSTAIIRGFAAYCQCEISTEEINQIAYEVEKVYHGTPSGIDNTTIAYEQPIIFSRFSGFSLLNADLEKMNLLVVDTGIRSRTIDSVSDVRKNFSQNEPLIREIGALVRSAVSALEDADIRKIGSLMNENQVLLQKITVSCPELDDLINIGRKAGAVGGKLTGAGRGGNFIILARDKDQAISLKKIYEDRKLRVIL